MQHERSAATLSNTSLARRAWGIRRKAVRMGEVQGQGYVGQALGVADVLAVSYFHALNFRPEDPEWENRDRFLLSIGHYAIALYAALIEAGRQAGYPVTDNFNGASPEGFGPYDLTISNGRRWSAASAPSS